jgi:REP element-mobilizing transposase RayT
MARRGRNSLIAEHFFFVTTTVVKWAHVFTEDKYCDILIKNIKHYQKRYKFSVLAYVIMPSHFHWIVEVGPTHGTISDIMRDVKKFTAWDMMEALKTDGKKELLRLFEREASVFPRYQRKFWMPRFDDEVIRNQQMFFSKLLYIHNNPVEAGLVERPEDYRFSSARNYILGDHSVLHIDTSLGGIDMWRASS